MSWKAIDRYSKDYIELQEGRASSSTRRRTPILRAQLEAWDKVIGQEGRREPAVQEGARVAEGVRAARGAVAERHHVDYKMAYNHYFRKKG
jgi:hypothetical protein